MENYCADGTYSPEDLTYTVQSSLKRGNFDPFKNAGLQTRYSEGYRNQGRSYNSAGYAWTVAGNVNPDNHAPGTNSQILSYTKSKKEYFTFSSNPTSYSTLGNTWN